MSRDRERDRGEVLPTPSLLPRMAYVEDALRHWQLQDLIPAVRLYVAPLPPRPPTYWDEDLLGRRKWIQLGSESYCNSTKYMFNVEYECGWCFHPNQKYYVRILCKHHQAAQPHLPCSSTSFHDAGVRLIACLPCYKETVTLYSQMKPEYFTRRWQCLSCQRYNDCS